MNISSEAPPVRILLLDDHCMVRNGLRHLLQEHAGWIVCGEAARGQEVIAMAAEQQPDVAVLDISVPGMNGLEVMREIKKVSPATECVFFTGQLTEDLVHTVFDAGGRSFLLKTDEPAEIVQAIEAASQHKPYFTQRISEIVYARLSRSAGGEKPLPGSTLTPRERQTIRLVAEGRSNKDVAAELGVSVRTAEAHRASLMKKLSLHTVGEVVRFAIRNKVIEP